jgi:hydroxymethylpyrimidine pyrophosphatase-like HAD family hydrolase
MSPPNQNIKWNDEVKFIISDVDETVADLYTDTAPELIEQLELLLQSGVPIFFVTGQGLQSVQERIINHIESSLRHLTLVGSCSGAEVWGYDKNGNTQPKPHYTVYDTALTDDQKIKWRELVTALISEFELQTYPVMSLAEFKEKAKDHPRNIMFEDRGPQITLEIVNGYNLTTQQLETLEIHVPVTNGVYDLRVPIMERVNQLFSDAGLPVIARQAGVFAIDFAIKGISKTTAIRYVLENKEILTALGLTTEDIETPHHLEIWGDKFSSIRGGTDRHMSEALQKEVRSIDFRDENPDEFLDGYNIVVWDGKHHLQHGLLEYLRSRHSATIAHSKMR